MGRIHRKKSRIGRRNEKMIFTSEQVSDGHPDKICDQISDAILTECLKQDKKSRVAIEALIKDWNIVLAGELTTTAELDFEDVIYSVLKRIGLEDASDYRIINLISEQSADISLGVDTGGAGDQGMMFGYATNETPEMLPFPYMLATKALKRLRALEHPFLKPDAKAQVSFNYETEQIDTFLISTQHSEDMEREKLEKIVHGVMADTATSCGLKTNFKKLINPTGKFVIGSSFADSGLTGRKIIADTYGGMARHGGGAFSGKDPSKVDRSGAYIARKIAKDILKKRWADKCEVQISYAIGVKQPTSVYIECFGTSKVSQKRLNDYVFSFDLTPDGIIKTIDLLNVDYNSVSTYGHFGKDSLPWE